MALKAAEGVGRERQETQLPYPPAASQEQHDPAVGAGGHSEPAAGV